MPVNVIILIKFFPFLHLQLRCVYENYEGTISIGGREITNLRFVDDSAGLAGEEEELANLVERLDKDSTAYGMEICAEKTKLMTNNTSGINTEIKVNGQKLETVTSFKYMGSVTNKEVRAKIQQAIGPHEDLTIVKTQTAVVWSCGPFIRSGQNHLARHSEREKKTRQTEEEVGRQRQVMDRPGVRQVPEGSGEQGKVEKTSYEIICGAPTTLAVKG